MLNSKIHFDETYLRELYQRSQATLLEMAAPSYLHRNPLIRGIVAWRMRKAMGFLDLERGKNLLDFGCGAGILFLQLPQDGRTYYGVDLELWPAEQMLAHHGRKDIQLFASDDWADKVANNSLDNLTALEVLEHVEDLHDLLATFKTKLKPGGRLIVSGPTENTAYQIARKISGFSGEYHVRDIFAIREAIRATGFVRKHSAYLPLPGPACLFMVDQYSLEDRE